MTTSAFLPHMRQLSPLFLFSALADTSVLDLDFSAAMIPSFRFVLRRILFIHVLRHAVFASYSPDWYVRLNCGGDLGNNTKPLNVIFKSIFCQGRNQS